MHSGRDGEAVQWERAWAVANEAARLLRAEFGATSVVAFGSIAHRAWFGPGSDIDLAVRGVPGHLFYRAVAAVTGFSPEFSIDLVDQTNCAPAIRRAIETEGISL